MKERPIIFSGPMVTSILRGEKTQTRRVVRFRDLSDEPQHHNVWRTEGGWQDGDEPLTCPFGQTGDRLWVREAHAFMADGMPTIMTKRGHVQVLYRADCHEDDSGERTGWWCGKRFISTAHGDLRWRPSIHMPRWASRITLEVVSVRVERLQAITEEDARAEGITDGGCLNCGEPEPCECPYPTPDARDAFIGLWESVNGEKPGCNWFSDPWVWVIEFRQVTP